MSEQKATLQITGMTCAACSTRIEKVLNKMDGVVEANVNLTMERATVVYADDKLKTGDLIARVEKLGYGAVEFSEERGVDSAISEAALKRQMALLALPFALVMLSMVGLPTYPHLLMNPWVQLAIATPIQFVSGYGFYVGAYKALRNKSANMDVLVALGTSAAYAYSIWMMARGAVGVMKLKADRPIADPRKWLL